MASREKGPQNIQMGTAVKRTLPSWLSSLPCSEIDRLSEEFVQSQIDKMFDSNILLYVGFFSGL
jgi:hypothetical protein